MTALARGAATRAAALASLCACLAACGGGGGSFRIDGTVSGISLSPRDSAFVAAAGECGHTTAGTPIKGVLLTVLVADTAGQCAAAQGDAAIRSTTSLTMTLVRLGTADPPAFAPGSYTVSAAPQAQTDGSVISIGATLDRTDAACRSTVTSGNGDGIDATGGTIIFSVLSAAAASGSFDLAFPNGGKLAGSFTTGPCSLPIAVFCSGGASTSCR